MSDIFNADKAKSITAAIQKQKGEEATKRIAEMKPLAERIVQEKILPIIKENSNRGFNHAYIEFYRKNWHHWGGCYKTLFISEIHKEEKLDETEFLAAMAKILEELGFRVTSERGHVSSETSGGTHFLVFTIDW
ncbi:MAG: hypothetical protein Q7R98_00145 [Candidatus Jorgensenbacteria bacterium]|nr:hypothetical protein [Candidatus Jorgensenbacteria bacterium]